MSADRTRYGEQQAELLRALHTGQNAPAGFANDDLAAASRALLDKRARGVAQSWPVLSHALGTDFPALFERYARDVPPPASGAELADGFAFASSLERGNLTADAKTELVLARGSLKLRGTRVVERRGIFLAASLLGHPRRLLIVIHLPVLGRHHAALRLSRGHGE